MKLNLPFAVVILAAGKGTRMKSSQAKVLHEVFFRPMLHHVLLAVKPLQPSATIVVVGHQGESVEQALRGYDVSLVWQKEQLGTGHAVRMTEPDLPADGLIMILCGDSPLIQYHSLQKMVAQHLSQQCDLTVMTTLLDNPTGYGRILSDNDSILAVVEEKDADAMQKEIREINAGIYLVNRNLLLQSLHNINAENAQGEYYLTDIVAYAVSAGYKVRKQINPCPEEVLGVNSREDLEAAHRQLQRRRNIDLMQQGVTLHNRDTVSVSPFSVIGCDTTLMANVMVAGKSRIGESCLLENGTVIKDCTIGNHCRIGAYSVLEGKTVAAGTEIPPLTVSPRSQAKDCKR